MYAEPLYYNGYVFIATENNSVYALSATTGAIVWSTHLGTPADSLAPPYACNGDGPDITPIIGITGTPVIDPTTGTIYVAALIRNTGYVLFALNVHTGQEQWNASITASGFDYMPEEERGALALSNGLVYVPFGGYSYDCVQPGPIGWVFAMSTSGGVVSAYEVPSGNEADVWTPEGVTVDSSGFVYIVTGNSYYNATYNYGDSVIKLTSNLTVVSYFAPSNWAYLGPADLDQDTTGATLLPDNLIFSIGKSGVGYLLNSSDLGGIGGQLYSAQVCGSVAAGWPYGAWGSTSYANSIIYVPCGTGLNALKLEPGANPMFISLWNYTGIWAGPPIIAGDAVWTVDINSGNFYALNPQTGSVLFQMSAGPVEHFTTPSAGGGLVFLAANQTIYAINPSSSSSAGGADDLIFNALTLSSIAPLSVYCAGVFEVDSSSNFARRLDFLGSPTMNI